MSNDHSAECVGSDKTLTKTEALRLVANADGIDFPWDGWTHITDEAALVLRQVEDGLYLDDLMSLTPRAAAALSEVKGELTVGLKEVSLDVARALVQHRGGRLGLLSVQSIADDVAEVLSQYDGELSLGLAHMTATAAEYLLNGKAEVDVNVLADTAGTLALAFKQKASHCRPALPWIAGPPEEDGDYFVMIQDSVDSAYYPIEIASVSIDDGTWCLKQLAESGQHLDVEDREICEIICHYPVPDFEDVPASYADAYVKQQIAKKTLRCIGRKLRITADSGRLLPKAKKLRSIEVCLAAIGDVLENLVAMPSLQNLTVFTETLSDDQCRSFREFKGSLIIRSLEPWRGFRQLTDEGAEFLAQMQGSLAAEVSKLPDGVAEILRKNPRFSEVDPDDC